MTSATDDRTEDLVRSWVELRERNEAAATTTLPPDGLMTVTWADLARFARDPEKFRAWLESGRALTDPEDLVRDEIVIADVPNASSVPRGVDPADFGIFVHEVLQRLASDGNLDAAIDASLPHYDFAKQRAAAIAAARTLAGHALAARVAGPAPGARVEVPFMVRLDRLLVRGIIDRIDTTADGTTITDYKVGERSDEHTFQICAYLWAAQRAGVSDARARVVYLREHGVEVVDVPSDATLETIARDLDRAI